MKSRSAGLVLSVLAVASLSVGGITHAQAPKEPERLGPIPRDLRKPPRDRTAVLPSVQRDAFSFASKGERTLLLETRIVGGSPAPVGAYPWQVSIGLVDIPASLGHFCGGSIIGANWVVTAAHCVDGTTRAEGLKVVYATNFLSQRGKETRVKEVIVNESWDRASFDYDVALLRTTDAMDAAPIKLLKPEQAVELMPVGVLGTVSGWGLTREGGATSDVLQHVGVQVQSNDICNSPTAYSGEITDRMVCAGFATGGKDSCQGDSGGPFVVFDRMGGYSLAGVVSWGEGCARPNKFGIYTRVPTVAAWIAQKTGT